MKGASRKRTVLVSMSVILLCMTIIAGMTFALFTDTKKVKNHLQAGDLEITLKRTELVKTTLNAEGYLVESDPDTTIVNFSESTDENVFGIVEDEKIVPGTKYVSTMQIENHSDVAFGYWIEIVCTDKETGANLAKQIKVTVDTGEDTEDASDLIGNNLLVGSASAYVDELIIGEADTFVVTVEFLDSFVEANGLEYSDNDLAQNENLMFDLIVHAVQATDAPTA